MGLGQLRMMRTYKKVTDYPPELLEMISLVNILPADAEKRLINLRERFDPHAEDPEVYNGFPVSIKELLGAEIIKYCFRAKDLIHWSIERYEDLIKARNIFQSLAKINQEIKPLKSQQKFSSERCLQVTVVSAFNEVDINNKRFPGSYLGFDDDGNIRPQSSELLDIFTENKIPFYRFRSCPNCLELFLAKRVTAKTCGKKKCVEKVSGSEYQKNNKAEINLKKREAYYIATGLPYCPTCIRPLVTHAYADCPLNKRRKNGTL